ncbi:hypothetical protein PGT21_007753 [Puccinia graminis f. sp. tritici]|uniref:DUF7918 domain-containing protein n=1 Tax=Puccinia graminis f. sp. tritici TaxID=56615 RepID=A0A5B0QZX7_PUCGR|nr:hypothetical protein PGT21_007753 [Puccinia graminis f. sp. tritici]
MPTNAISAASCTIKLLDPTKSTASTACPEYLHQSLIDPKTGAHQEIVTIESKASHRFEISYDIHPTASDLLAKKSSNHSRSNKTCRSLRMHDYALEIWMDGLEIATSCSPRSRKLGPMSMSEVVENETSVRAFEFAPLKLVDPDDQLGDDEDEDDRGEKLATKLQVCQDEKIIKALGKIEVRFFKCKLTTREAKKSRAKSTGIDPTWTKTTNEMRFSEAVKIVGLSATAGLSQPTIIDPSPKGGKFYRIKSQDENPFLHFIFHYKPRPVLIAEGTIVPPALRRNGRDPSTAIRIESDSEPEKEQSKRSKKEKARERVVKKEEEGCRCACKKREPDDDAVGDPQSSSDPKRSRPSDGEEDQKPNIDEKPNIDGST